MKSIKKLTALLLSIITTVSLLASIPTVRAEGSTVNTGLYYLVNVATGKYLSLKDNQDKNGNEITLANFDKDAVNLVFKVKLGTSGAYKLQPAQSTTKFMDAANATSGTKTLLQAENTKQTQEWYFYVSAEGIYTVRSAQNTSLTLTADKSEVSLAKYADNNRNQQWKLVEFSLRKNGDDPSIRSYGIDVSYHQDDINWKAVKEYGVDFAIIRIGYSEVKDKKFEDNYKEAVKNGIDVGVYIYTYNKTVAHAKEDADYVLKWLNKRALQLPVFYDIEDNDYQGGLSTKLRTDMCIAFMTKIKKAGYEAGVYSSQSWFTDKLDLARLREVGDTWLAKWPASDQANENHSDYEFWQYRSDGKVAGIQGNVDMNVSYGKYDRFDYTGNPITPMFSAVASDGQVLNLGTDYVINYDNNVNAGIATAHLVGINAYEGLFYEKKEFYITPINLAFCDVAPVLNKTYTGAKLIPTVNMSYKNITLKEDVDFTLSGKDNVNAGKATVMITGKGNFTGEIRKNFTIYKRNINQTTISGVYDTGYTGKTRTLLNLNIKIGNKTLKKNKDYTVTYKNNIKYGTATATIKGIGANFGGTITKTFNIVPQKPESVKFTRATRTSVSISWSKVSSAHAYQIYRATSKDGKYTRIYTTSNGKTLSFTDKKVKEGTYYYYKVRAIRKFGNKTLYGIFSSVKTTKTNISDTSFNLTYNQSKKEISVNIKEDSSVTGYMVYMYNSKSKSYKKVWTGKTTKYVKTDVIKNKSYSFKIQTYKKTPNGYIYGKRTSAKTIKAK